MQNLSDIVEIYVIIPDIFILDMNPEEFISKTRRFDYLFQNGMVGLADYHKHLRFLNPTYIDTININPESLLAYQKTIIESSRGILSGRIGKNNSEIQQQLNSPHQNLLKLRPQLDHSDLTVKKLAAIGLGLINENVLPIIPARFINQRVRVGDPINGYTFVQGGALRFHVTNPNPQNPEEIKFIQGTFNGIIIHTESLDDYSRYGQVIDTQEIKVNLGYQSTIAFANVGAASLAHPNDPNLLNKEDMEMLLNIVNWK